MHEVNQNIKQKKSLRDINDIKVMVESLHKQGTVIYYDLLIEKIAELQVETEEDILEKLTYRNPISKYVINKLKTKEDQLLDFNKRKLYRVC